MRRAILSIVALSALAGCTESGSSGARTNVSGMVMMGAPVAGATVTVYGVDPGSRRLTALGSTQTSTAGAYSLGVLLSGPYLIVATGGSYKDDATAVVRSLAVVTLATLDDPRPGVLETMGGTGGARPSAHHLTPLTTIASRRVVALAVANTPDVFTEGSVTAVNAAVAKSLHVGTAVTPVDPRTLLPLDYTNPSDGAAIKKDPLAPAALYGAALSGLSKLASSLALADALPLIEALADDFSDGAFDGMKTAPNGNPVPVPAPVGASGTLSPTAATSDLQQATMSFLDDPSKNASGTTAATVGPK